MTYQKLDNDELLRLALGAMNSDRDAEAIDLLKTLLEREPGHGQAQFLLAAMHAQIGMMDRAEAGFRAAVEALPDLGIARFQLGQLLLLQGRVDETRAVLAPLADQAPGDALGAYARALSAAAADDGAGAIAELQSGLACAQEIPALTGDMQRLLERLQSADGAPPPAAPLFLSGYGRQ
jgi:predicted Zn-dependent protease